MNNREVRTTLRLDKPLYDKIKKEARSKKRSINQQIAYILLQWFSSVKEEK